MKTIIKLKFILSIIAIAAFMLVLKSCKKVDSNATNLKEAEATRAAAIQAIKAQYGNVSAGIVFNVDKTADEVFYKNAAGNMVSLYGSGKQAVAAPCLYNCNNTTNPANLRIVYTLNYVQRFYLCESSSISPAKSTVSVKWTVSAPFTITNVTPDGVLNTFGKVKFTPSSGPAVILTATANDAGFTVTNLGTDPGCSMNTLYSVTYYFNDVDNSNFASGTQLDALLSLSNDCALIGYLSATGYVSGPSFNQNAYLPCNRIDKVYVVPGAGSSGCATATGNYNICLPPSGFSPINYHQLEYRKVTSGSSLLWDNQSSTVYQGEPAGTGTESPIINPYTGTSNLIHMTSSSGTWLVRYRNVNTSSCNTITPVNSNWGNNWITEIWPL